MTKHKPLTEVWFTTQLADYNCNMYNVKKEVFQVFPILTVKSAVQLLKEKVKNRDRYTEGWANLILFDIDEAFPIFKEESEKK